MKKLVSVVIMMLLMTGISFGYTLTIQVNGKATTREVEAGKIVMLSLGDRSAAEYTVSSGNAILQVEGNRRQVVMPEGDVSITIEKLCTVTFNSNGGNYISSKKIPYGEAYGSLETPIKNGHIFKGWYLDSGYTEAVTAETVVSKTTDHTLYAKWAGIQAGDYIAYQPTNTEYTVTGGDSGTGINQVFNPSSVTSWKVLKGTTDGDYLEIISAESVGNLTLTGKTGYIYAVNTLNNLCAAYVNPTYATSGRCLGYGNGEGIIDESKYPITWEETYTNGNKGFPYVDSNSSEDIRLMNVKDGEEYPLHVSDTVWLASRGLSVSSGYANFVVRCVGADGGVFYNYLYQSFSDGGSRTGSPSYGVRPVVSLKSGIQIVGGDGSSENPWQISLTDSF